MSDFLGQMAAASRARVGELAAREPLARLRGRAERAPAPPALRRRDRFDLIAEIKRRSPAAGPLGGGDLAARATAYAEGGAAAVSVLTEPTRFDGALGHLQAVAGALAPLGVPAMRKDFVVDPYQLYETRAAGAGGVLLIVRLFEDGLLGELLDCARGLGLFVLLEAFDEDDLARIGGLVAGADGEGAPLLAGVNCRDLATLDVRRERLLELAPRLPAGAPRVAESGIESAADCAGAARAGYELALVGTALMRAAEPGRAVRELLAAGRAA